MPPLARPRPFTASQALDARRGRAGGALAWIRRVVVVPPLSRRQWIQVCTLLTLSMLCFWTAASFLALTPEGGQQESGGKTDLPLAAAADVSAGQPVRSSRLSQLRVGGGGDRPAGGGVAEARMQTNAGHQQLLKEQALKWRQQQVRDPALAGASDPSQSVVQPSPVALSPPGSFPSSSTADTSPIPLLLFTYNRADNLRQTIVSILANRPGDTRSHPLFISQDGEDGPTRSVALEFVSNAENNPRWKDIHFMNFRWGEQQVPVDPAHSQWTTYYKISTHYRWALGQIFDALASDLPGGEIQPPLAGPMRFEHVILLEDDMHVAPDFFSYFRRLRSVLDADPTLLCVSGWNDNGRSPLAQQADQLYRSECFPGLGWMLSRGIWAEMYPKWPPGFWDDWLREPPQRRGRSCIFPEVNRVYTFGDKGSSAGQFYDQYLRGIRLNQVDVDWASRALGYITSEEKYVQFLGEKIKAARRVDSVQDIAPSAVGGMGASSSLASSSSDAPSPAGGEFVLSYHGLPGLDAILQKQNMMVDHKAGVPRTSFRGVLSFTTPQNQRVWIVPDDSPFLQN